MQIKLLVVTFAVATLPILASCNRSAESEAAKAQQAQVEANAKVAKALVEGQVTADAAQRDANEKIAQANAKAQKDAAQAQLVANQDIRAANDGSLKLRNDYQVATSTSLSKIDNRIDSLKLKAQAAKPTAKAQFESLLPKVVAQRATVTDDLSVLGNQTALTLSSYKARTDKDIDQLKKVVEEAAVKL